MNANVGTFERSMRIAVGLNLTGLSRSGLVGWWGLTSIVPKPPVCFDVARRTPCWASVPAKPRVN
jgi:hypothetical protein